MNDCPLQLVGSKWLCPDCGWVYPRPSAKPPRRKCPKSPQGIASTHAQIRTAALQEADINYHHRPTDELDAIIATCLSNACGKYSNGCPSRFAGSPCNRRRGWLKSLSSVGFRDCLHWGT